MSDTSLRFSIFFGVFAVFAVMELVLRNRTSPLTRRQRWPGAWALLIVGSATSRLALPAGLVGVALFAEAAGMGIFNALNVPTWLAIGASLALLDLAVWGQHLATHRIPLLWRLHRVHHTDPEVDVTTALRFHPGEILISLGYKAVIVVVLGAPAIAVFWFEVALNAMAMFNHANIRLPRWLDRVLRWFVVTPDMHVIHHSTREVETNSNYGFCLSIWDRLFRTYTKVPDTSLGDFRIGQDHDRTAPDQAIWSLIRQPLKSGP